MQNRLFNLPSEYGGENRWAKSYLIVFAVLIVAWTRENFITFSHNVLETFQRCLHFRCDGGQIG